MIGTFFIHETVIVTNPLTLFNKKKKKKKKKNDVTLSICTHILRTITDDTYFSRLQSS